MTDNTNIIKEASQRNTLKDLVDGAYAAIQLGEIESARVMLKSALALIEKGEVRFGGTLEGAVPLFVTPTKDFKLRYLVIPLEQEQSE